MAGNALVRALASLALRGGRRGALSILIFHRVLAEPDAYYGDIDAASFERIVAFLRANFAPLPLGQALAALRDGRLPRRGVCITFDDGYADNYHLALPILCKHGVPATFFVSTGFLRGEWMWNDLVLEALRRTPQRHVEWRVGGEALPELRDEASRRQAAETVIRALKYRPPQERDAAAAELAGRAGFRPPGPIMMTPQQVRALHEAGMEIGGHTVSHPVLTTVPLAQARREIVAGRELLQELVEGPVRFFAYPNGKPGRDYTGQHARLVEELGFTAALSTAWGVAGRGSDWFQLPRFTPWDRSPLRFGLRLCQNALRNAQGA